jgi:hypothetical protein
MSLIPHVKALFDMLVAALVGAIPYARDAIGAAGAAIRQALA